MNYSEEIATASIDQTSLNYSKHDISLHKLTLNIKAAWDKIAPTWPLQDYIARNPLSGLETLDFKDAIKIAHQYFESDFNFEIKAINAQTIKWCQAYFDKGQATIFMPNRNLGLYNAWKELAVYDNILLSKKNKNIEWLKELSDDPKLAIKQCLNFLEVKSQDELKFITLMLVSLSGWAGYIKYLVNYGAANDEYHTTLFDYLAFRLATTYLLWPGAIKIINLAPIAEDLKIYNELKKIEKKETEYRVPLLKDLQVQANNITSKLDEIRPKAQLVFCIDVRSEPFRLAIEKQGHYQTYGFAGFFGIPVSIKEYESKQITACCPVLLKPNYIISEVPIAPTSNDKSPYDDRNAKLGSALYQSLKYNFTTTFALVETLGPWLGIYMALKTLAPSFTSKLKNYFSLLFRNKLQTEPCYKDIISISLADRCNYAKSALCMMGLTDNFSRLILLCGHGSTTINNTDRSGLDCGACGGHHGGINAQILATILNQVEVRKYLVENNINISTHTQFIAGEHNTTTDDVTIFDSPKIMDELNLSLQELKADLIRAKTLNNSIRVEQLGSSNAAQVRSTDWSQTRPEWGLAKNASFIIGSRDLTKGIDLKGRSFLHSYNWEIDTDGALLETILTAPMIVAEWINTQYLFSTINNVAYGSGSKITQNVTCKTAIMQGNASDLMYGLSLQSVNSNDGTSYHEPVRLLTVVYAPVSLVDNIVKRQKILQKLFGNNWVSLVVIEPASRKLNMLCSDLTWKVMP